MIICSFCFFLANIILLCESKTIELYVSPNGNNTNNGSYPSSPFKTLNFVQQYIRDIKAINPSNTTLKFIVNLMNGTFYLTKSLDFIPKDSGYSIENNIIYKSYEKNSNPVIISGGYLLPYSCFKQTNIYQNIFIYQCNISKYINYIKKPNFRSIRIGMQRGQPSRYPKLQPSDDPYTDGWLFIKSSKYLNNSQFLIGVDSNKLLPSLRQNKSFNKAMIQIFPTHSWINIEIIVEPSIQLLNNNSNLTYFKVTCPESNNKCNPHSNSNNIAIGNRFYFYNIPTDIVPIQQNNEWYFNTTTNMLFVGSTQQQNNINTPINVIIPNTDYIIRFLGDINYMTNKVNYVENIVLNNITFMDSDYTSYGFQNAGFNTKPYDGIPSDGSIRISGSNNINITYCKFLQLGSGGIIISNKSENILISNNEFNHIGQSGIMLVGNNTSQSIYITIKNNTISYIGDILASAGGIYGSSVSNSRFIYNNISHCSRWGISIRSQNNNSMSYKNNISYNIINYIGLKTSDFGGISLIGNGYTGTYILYNCIKNSIGIDTNKFGEILRPFNSDGIYLDNWSSGFYIYGNIANKNVLSGIDIHGGHSNYIENNIFYNTSEFSTSNSNGHVIMGQLDIREMHSGQQPYNNSIIRNVFFYYNISSLLIQDFNGNFKQIYCKEIDYNLYYNPNIKISDINIANFTPAGSTWNDWINGYNKMYDQHSIIDHNPMFLNETAGNFIIQSDSPLLKQLKFKQIPKYIAQNC
eukprot:311906_1